MSGAPRRRGTIAVCCLRYEKNIKKRIEREWTEPVPWVVDRARTNTGIFRGSTADLTAACRETAAQRRVTTRDMFSAVASALVYNRVHIIRESSAPGQDSAVQGGFSLLFRRLTYSQITSHASWSRWTGFPDLLLASSEPRADSAQFWGFY